MSHRSPLPLILLALTAAPPLAAHAVQESPAVQTIKDVDIVENLNEKVPFDALFTDQDGRKIRFGDLFDGDKPIVLTMVYYECPMLCSMVLNALKKAAMNSGVILGTDYQGITISIDPRETPAMAAEQHRGHLQAMGAPEKKSDWTFLVGEDAEIRKVADLVGFRYSYDAESKQYAHGAALMVLTPDGRVSRYLYGVEFPPRDLKFALLEAAGGRVGTSFDRVLLTCFRYDPNSRRYEFYINGFLRGGALLVFFALASMLAVYWRREYKRGSIQ
jgi:protein SCO1